jgi:hypothetical protein
LLAWLGLPLLVLTQIAWIPCTNFDGFDDWPIIDISSRGILDAPNANRPLAYLWLLPNHWLGLHRLGFFAFLYLVYWSAGAWLVYALVRRLAPERQRLALLTASLFVVWAPGDLYRLNTVGRALYAGFAVGALAALALLVESWLRRNRLLLGAAALVAFVAVRSYEGTLPILAGGWLLLFVARDRGGRLLPWLAAWTASLVAAAALAVRPALLGGPEASYQLSVLGVTYSPWELGRRLFLQYAYHLVPLVNKPLSELLVPAVPAALIVFAALLVWGGATEGGDHDHGPDEWRWLLKAAGLGLAFAGLGYGLVVVGSAAPTALRLQFLSAPGIALALAAAACLASAALPLPWRRAGVAVACAWVVAVGTGRTLAMQQIWDAESFHPRQQALLESLAHQAPDVVPGTLLVLLDGRRAWPATFGFHHAVRYLYQGRALGMVFGAWDALYPATFTAAGVEREPWPMLREAWGERPGRIPYDHVVAVRASPAGQATILREWPPELPALPAGKRYAPESRILADAPPHPQQRILGGNPP